MGFCAIASAWILFNNMDFHITKISVLGTPLHFVKNTSIVDDNIPFEKEAFFYDRPTLQKNIRKSLQKDIRASLQNKIRGSLQTEFLMVYKRFQMVYKIFKFKK